MEDVEKNKPESEGKPGTGTCGAEEQDNKRMFTQEEVDRIVRERLSRERRKKPEAAGEEQEEEAGTTPETEEGAEEEAKPKGEQQEEKPGIKNPAEKWNLAASAEEDRGLLEAFGLDSKEPVDSGRLARLRAMAAEEAIENGKMKPLINSEGKKKKSVDALMRSVFGLPAKKGR